SGNGEHGVRLKRRPPPPAATPVAVERPAPAHVPGALLTRTAAITVWSGLGGGHLLRRKQVPRDAHVPALEHFPGAALERRHGLPPQALRLLESCRRVHPPHEAVNAASVRSARVSGGGGRHPRRRRRRRRYR
ncbi:unnamed protein product, partial [Ectocarpus sp. 4 AP-2014]